MRNHYNGGYYQLNEDMVRGGLHAHTQAHPESVSEGFLKALNIVQATPWRINPFVLTIMRTLYEEGSTLGGIPEMTDWEPPARLSEEEWEELTPAEKTERKQMLMEVHEHNAKMVGKRESFLRMMNVAREMSGYAEFYFPHFADFRSRLYPLPQDLNPQGDQICKSLLMFRDGHRLGERGLYWLAITLANTYGKDKLTFEERHQWTLDNHDLIVDSANDPLDGKRFWATSDEEPWVFLAACKEWAEAHSLPNPQDYESRIPCAMDGVCNGLQHLSLIGKDRRGAVATNCSSDPTRYDLYTEVADAAKEIVAADAATGSEQAHAWVGNVGRSTVKRAVMTTPYGVTRRGIQTQLIKDGHTKELSGEGKDNSNYMTDVIQQALANTVSAATVIMQYFQDVAKVLADDNCPFRWKTSNGFEVVQSYYNLTRRDVKTTLGKLTIWDESDQLGLNPRKQANSASPNVIHSQDAAMLQMTAVALNERYGITDFAFIHDSYGVHHAFVDQLHEVLREVAIEMYSGDWLKDFHEYVLSYAPRPDAIPTPPPVGDFDIAELKHARYFFS